MDSLKNITWSVMEKQTAQAKKIYFCHFFKLGRLVRSQTSCICYYVFFRSVCAKFDLFHE